MIFEYAIEPELVATWGTIDKSRYFRDHLGLGKNRIVSEFPKLKNWRRRVLTAAAHLKNTSDHDRILELIDIVTEKMISREDYSFDGTIPWLENAEEEYENKKFEAILSRENPRRRIFVLTDGDLTISDKWNKLRGDSIPRRASEMAAFISSMLANCREAIFVDPHFDPREERYRRPLKEFLKILVEKRIIHCFPRVEVHASDSDDKPAFSLFRDRCLKNLPPIIPSDLTLVIKRWRQRSGGERLHNRYIITDIGGVAFNCGLDEGEDGETDDVTLLEKKQYLLRWQQYASDTPAFELTGEPIAIAGRKV
jgi:hypothetical protein